MPNLKERIVDAGVRYRYRHCTSRDLTNDVEQFVQFAHASSLSQTVLTHPSAGANSSVVEEKHACENVDRGKTTGTHVNLTLAYSNVELAKY